MKNYSPPPLKVILKMNTIQNVPSSQSLKTKDPTFSNEEPDEIRLPTKYYQPKRTSYINVHQKSNSVNTKANNMDESTPSKPLVPENQTRQRRLIIPKSNHDQQTEATNERDSTERQIEQAFSQIDDQSMLYSRKAYLLKKFQQASKKIENAYNPTEQSHQQIRSLRISQDKI